MKLVDVAARNAKELETLKRKVAAFLKSKQCGCNTGEVTWDSAGREFWVQVENDGQLGDYLRDIINKSPNARNIKVEEHKADYMWDIDKYIRPVSIVTFTF
jgi:hypothetical protein